MSTSVTWRPAVATTWAMPLPMIPPPTTTTRCMFLLEAERAADDLLHDLGRAAVEALHASVAPHARDLVLLHVAVAAVQLQAEVDDLELQLGRPVLGARRVLGRQLAGHLELQAAIDVHAGHLHLGRRLGEREAVGLEGADRL